MPGFIIKVIGVIISNYTTERELYSYLSVALFQACHFRTLFLNLQVSEHIEQSYWFPPSYPDIEAILSNQLHSRLFVQAHLVSQILNKKLLVNICTLVFHIKY